VPDRHAAAERFALQPPPPSVACRYRAEEFWTDRTLGGFADERLRALSALELRVWSEARPHKSTLGRARERASRVAAGLRRLGVGPGDLVAYQLPNWAEAAECFWGIALLGAVPVPVVHFYGPKETRFILAQSGARVLVTAARFRGIDYLERLPALRAASPHLEEVVVVGEDVPSGCVAFNSLADADPLPAPVPVDPDAPALVAYTSGTTADPKGVIHSHRTMLAEVTQLSRMQAQDAPPALVGAPVAHGIGLLAGLFLPLSTGRPVHLIDVWEPAAVLAATREGGLGAGSGAPYFLASLLDAPGFGPEDAARMRRVGLGGAPVPAALCERAAALGIAVARAYGSTEHPSTTGSRHDEPAAKRMNTDGRPLPGVEIRLLGRDGREVSPGAPGEITSRGPDRFVGYTDPALSEAALDADGWYASGDIGVLDADGYLTITDRLKDIIIRGGENVSAAEVEEVLVRLPGVAEVAVVAAPDERLGEHGCAFFRMRHGGDAPGLDDVRRHLAAAGLAKQKWPEEIRSVADFERTASGKIKKFVLRERLRRETRGIGRG
jgi:acyl-CoA synthetase (AMP-forming)/AMP-acid ligase II